MKLDAPGLRGLQDVDNGQGMTFETDLAAFEAALWLAAELSSKRPDLRGETSVVVTPRVAEKPTTMAFSSSQRGIARRGRNDWQSWQLISPHTSRR